MSKYYFELTLKPENDYELFLDLIDSLTTDALEEDNGAIIIRSEDELGDLKFGIEEFAKTLSINCKITYEKKENIDWIKQYQESVKSVEIGNLILYPQHKLHLYHKYQQHNLFWKLQLLKFHFLFPHLKLFAFLLHIHQ